MASYFEDWWKQITGANKTQKKAEKKYGDTDTWKTMMEKMKAAMTLDKNRQTAFTGATNSLMDILSGKTGVSEAANLRDAAANQAQNFAATTGSAAGSMAAAFANQRTQGDMAARIADIKRGETMENIQRGLSFGEEVNPQGLNPMQELFKKKPKPTTPKVVKTTY